MNDELGTRRLHHWVGRDREKDIAALADAIAATGELFNHDGSLVQLDVKGALVPIGRDALHRIIDQHIAAVRVVKNGTGWRKEYFTYAFAPRPRSGPPTMANPTPDAGTVREPDDKALDEIYRNELLWRLPRVEQ